MNTIDNLQTLDFLEPAKTKLTSLTLSNCVVDKNVNAWASLFKLDKLRFLDLLGSSIDKALVGENVVQRLLAAMPNLTRLAVDPGLVKDFYVDTWIRSQGSVAKRLDFLGVMENEAIEIRKAKLLANAVAYFGSVEGELRVLEYYSNRLNTGYSDSTLETLLKNLSLVTPTPPWKTVAVISLLMKIIRHHGAEKISEIVFTILKKLLTIDVAAKMGDVLLDQCIGAFSAFLTRWSGEDPMTMIDPEAIGEIIDIIMNLDGKLCVDHYVTVVPAVMLFIAETDMRDFFLYDIGMKDSQELMKNIAQLLEKVADRFPGEIKEHWVISSVLNVMKGFKNLIDFDAEEDDKLDLMEIFSSMIASLRKLCLNSSPRSEGFCCHRGVKIVMDFLTVTDDCLCLTDRDSFALLDILKSILQDTRLSLSESGKIVSDIEKLLITVHSQWELWKSSNSDGEATHYLKMKNITSLLNYLESDPRFDYKTSGAVKEIIMKLK